MAVMTDSQTWILDVNLIYHCADDAFVQGRIPDALSLYLLLARSDDSLDAGEVGYWPARCYEILNDLNSARYWADRAVAENPTIEQYLNYRRGLGENDDLSIVGRLQGGYVDKLGLSRKLRERKVKERVSLAAGMNTQVVLCSTARIARCPGPARS
jgi:hypothetical protein